MGSSELEIPLEKIDFKRISLKDFEFDSRALGVGSFGQVFKSKFRPNNQTYAIKVISKDFISTVSWPFVNLI